MPELRIVDKVVERPYFAREVHEAYARMNANLFADVFVDPPQQLQEPWNQCAAYAFGFASFLEERDPPRIEKTQAQIEYEKSRESIREIRYQRYMRRNSWRWELPRKCAALA